MSLRSIEFRLTAWFSLMLFAGYLVLGLALWVAVRYSVSEAVDDMLNERLTKLVATVEGDADEPEEIEEDIVELIMASPEGELARVRDAEGRQVFPSTESESESEAGDDFRVAEERPGDYRTLEREVSVLGQRYEILLVSSLESLERAGSRLASSLVIVTPIALILSSIGGLTIARRALRPVDAIAAAAESVTVHNLSHRLDVPDTGDALERLSRTFNQMLGRLQTSVARIEQFTGDASHELRSPVSVIRTTAELALRQGRSANDCRQDMEAIHAEARALSDLIDVLLTLSREGLENGVVVMGSVDLVALASEVCRQVRPDAERKGLLLDLIAPESPLAVSGNEAALRTLLTALLTNAVDHTHRGAIVVTVVGESLTIRLSVRDTGEGIPDEALPQVFERFFRVDPSRARAEGHVGLGLSIAQRIAELHHATIAVESQLGKGSAFTITFPRAEASHEI